MVQCSNGYQQKRKNASSKPLWTMLLGGSHSLDSSPPPLHPTGFLARNAPGMACPRTFALAVLCSRCCYPNICVYICIIHMMECYWTTKKDILTPCGGWTLRTPGSVREARHRRAKPARPHSQEVPRSPMHIETDGGSQGWGRGRESVLHGDRVSMWGDRKFWRRRVGITAQWLECASCH